MDEEISKRADCIIGVRANKGCQQLEQNLKDHIRKSGWLRFELEVDGIQFEFIGKGESALDLSDPREIVLRKSDYISSRTAAVHCSIAARDVPRQIVRSLQNPDTVGKLRILKLASPQANCVSFQH